MKQEPDVEAIAEIDRANVGLWLALIPAAGFLLRVIDVRDGIERLPLWFYALFVVGFALDAWEFLYRRPYIQASADELCIGPHVRILRSEILDVRVQRNRLGLRRIVIDRKDGRQWGQKAYLFRRPAEEIAAKIRDWAS